MEARQTYERLSAARRLLTTTLAVSGALFWVAALWPAHRTELHALAFPFWILILPATIVFAVRESIWHRRCEASARKPERWTS